jgi:hypothetical protein
VSPMHTKPGAKTAYVALCVYMQRPTSLEQGHSVHAVFELSIYNHSNGMYCGCKGRLMNIAFHAHPSYYSLVSTVPRVL